VPRPAGRARSSALCRRRSRPSRDAADLRSLAEAWARHRGAYIELISYIAPREALA
jgi:hypothetical protein